MNKLLYLALYFLLPYFSFSQTYEIILPLEKGEVPRDEYGNVVHIKDYISSEILYVEAKELDYILKRSQYGSGILLGSFEINNRIRLNSELVNTIWTPNTNGYFLKVWKKNEDSESEENTYYAYSSTKDYPNSKSYFIDKKSITDIYGKK